MTDPLKDYIHDLVITLHEKYNSTLNTIEQESEEDKAFRTGMNSAYYDTLDLIESQLKAFGYNTKEIGNIAPELSKKALLK